MPNLEIACFNVESAVIAASFAADRIELCNDQALGGTTPLLSTFQTLRNEMIGNSNTKTKRVPINVMIRPRGGDFSYSNGEFEQMAMEVEMFGREGVDGFVFGILKDKEVDRERCKFLLQKASGKPCTFHRAFDEIPKDNMMDELEVLIECGFKAVLTSGGGRNAVEGKERLVELVVAADGRIDVIIGGGVRSGNLERMREATGAPWFHSSAVNDGGAVASREEVRMLSGLVRK